MDVHEQVCKNIQVKKAGQIFAGMGKLAGRKSESQPSFRLKWSWKAPSTEGPNFVSPLVPFEWSESSYVSFDREDDPWPS